MRSDVYASAGVSARPKQVARAFDDGFYYLVIE